MKKLFSLVCAFSLSWVMARAEDPAEFKVSDLTFSRPKAFQWINSQSPMRKAQLKVEDGTSKTPGEIIFYHFGAGQGGGVGANVDRWFGQFQEGKDKIGAGTETKKVEGTQITYARANGTYMSGMPGGPKTALADHALLGAIVESPQGDIFIRFTGPVGLVKANEAAFKEMVESALKKK